VTVNDTFSDVEWYGRTSHCGACGNPGDYCTCPPSRPCSCRGLHRMGSGLAPDALDTFAVEVPDDHPELFGETP
jgi:hypothetical protein